ncbi:dienelactone hydrolase family protein [Streptomyces sp. NPDC048550]|uniref:dienelactone hydrolase family protein n=1 Tax=unclassified Streptomyces TaxID=2593676 RepID=UPI00224F0FD9|nr:dienelactone hydrolase family protein [Streptomyces sp. NBC_00320]MCX5149192.1 dienelactone hydrolase family protein [Streptomyces sp. NBC_00320]
MTYETVAHEVEIATGGAAPMTAYVARPAGTGRHPAVLVGAELWGLTEDVRGIVRQVAALGYVAIAPNLYHRSGPETATGLAENAANRERAFELLGQLTRDGVEEDLRAAVAHVRTHAQATEQTGVLGFSLGGHIAYFAATRLDLAAAAIFYPGWLPVAGTALSRPEPLLATTGSLAERDVRVLMFFAELDHVIDAEQRTQIAEALTAAGARHEEVVYPGARHAFFFPGREPYDKAAAEDSWARVRELFAAELGR